MKVITVTGSDQPETVTRFTRRKVQGIKMCCGHYANSRHLKYAERKERSKPDASLVLMCSCCQRYVTRPIVANQTHWDQLLITHAHVLMEVCRAVKRFPLKE